MILEVASGQLSNYSIYIEKNYITSSYSYNFIINLLFSYIYIFNLKYPLSFRATYTFIDNYFYRNPNIKISRKLKKIGNILKL